MGRLFLYTGNTKGLVLLFFVFRFQVVGIPHGGSKAYQNGNNCDEQVTSVCKKLMKHDIRVLTVSKLMV